MSTSTQIQKPQSPRERLSGTFAEVDDVNARLEAIAQNPSYHLVSPATSCDALPDGCEVAISLVVLAQPETYPIPGSSNRGIGKSALDRIAAAAGVVWAIDRSGRLDDGRDPHYCMFRVCGIMRAFDGSARPIQGTKQIDLRDGAALAKTILNRPSRENESQAQARARNEAELDRQRIEIVSMAETKARLRAIRSIGIRTSYTQQELQRPFVVAQTVFTGRTDDPELKPIFAAARAKAFLEAHSNLYGGAAPVLSFAPASPAEAAALLPEKRVEPPPPVETTKPDEDDEVTAAPAPQTTPVLYRLGPLQGQPFAAGDDAALSAYRAQVDGLLRDPRWEARRPKIEAHLADIDAEMQRRGAEAAFPFDDGLFS